MNEYVADFSTLNMADVERVGGKNASLGEMISNLSSLGIAVPGGFATTAHAYRRFLSQDNLDSRINERLANLNIDDVTALAETGKQIRQWILDTPFPNELHAEIANAYAEMKTDDMSDFSVAVRSSATAEDLPDASFAGQQETFLNVTGLDNVVSAVKKVFASLYTDRAIAYRVHQGFEHGQVALSAGIQHMVRSDLAASGVMFTLDTDSGFTGVVFITSSYGLGETIVQGAVSPDEFYVYKANLANDKPAILRRNLGEKAIKMVYDQERSVATLDVEPAERLRFSLCDDEIYRLAKFAVIIENHYGRPMDIEWAKDGIDGDLYILQARPETVQSRSGNTTERYRLQEKSDVLVEGRSIGHRIGAGNAKIIEDSSQMDQVGEGDVLVTDMTDPDWEPIMKRAAAIVTNRGGRTCHAAIIARELGVPAVVGCGDATARIETGQAVTVSCAQGDTGYVYEGTLDFEIDAIDIGSIPKIPVKIMLNVGNPERAFDFAKLPNQGIGLARLEFIINRMIGIHPKALLGFDTLSADTRQQVEKKIAGYAGPTEFFIEKLAEGIATLAAAFSPKPVIVRLSDFKSNEYANLLGGNRYEPNEENPMLGFRGASRYIDESFRECFELECSALRKVREDMGFTNVQIMVPFVRTTDEAHQVTESLDKNGLRRGENGLKLIMMCEIPSNSLLADDFLQYFDGFSIGSNDLTQLTLGLDRDSALVSDRFDERNPAVKSLLHSAIQACRKNQKYIGICGQGPSDYPDFAKWLLEEGIESISLNPDTVVDTWLYLAGQSVENGA